MMKKLLLIMLILLLVACNNATSNLNSENQTIPKDLEQAKIKEENNSVIQTIDIQSDADVLVNLSDPKVMYSISDAVVLLRIDEIEEDTNLNILKIGTSKYRDKIYTPGTATVLKVFKGNLKEGSIPFVRVGGVLPYDQWILGQEDSDKLNKVREEFNPGVLTKNIMVRQVSEVDVPVEKGKIYLAYVSTKYPITIISFEHFGFREVKDLDVSNLSKIDFNEVKVKDNQTREWVSLSELIN